MGRPTDEELRQAWDAGEHKRVVREAAERHRPKFRADLWDEAIEVLERKVRVHDGVALDVADNVAALLARTPALAAQAPATGAGTGPHPKGRPVAAKPTSVREAVAQALAATDQGGEK